MIPTEIPPDWSWERLKYLADVQTGITLGKDYGGKGTRLRPYLRVANVQDGYLDLESITEIAVPAEEASRCELRAGDVLMTEGGDFDKLGRGYVWTGQIPGCLHQNHVFAVRPHKDRLDPHFLAAVMTSHHGKAYFTSTSQQTTNLACTNSAKIKEFLIPLPPLHRQRRIVGHLARETARIDALIDKKERLITLLEEKRAALTNGAVTMGLDASIPMQGPRVPWLGKVPTHWQFIRLKHLAIAGGSGIQMGPFGTMLTTLSSKRTPYRLYGQENTISGDFAIGDRWITEEQYLSLRKYALVAGDIVLTRKGSIGKARLLPDSITTGIMDSDTIRLRMDHVRIAAPFLVRLLHEAWYLHAQIEANSRGAILAGLNSTTIGDLLIALPPLPEQIAIGHYLDRTTRQIAAILSKIREQIAKFHEYRTALISAAVTGRIDVRGSGAESAGVDRDSLAGTDGG